MDIGNGEMVIPVTVPSCGCCSARIEEDVGNALGLPRGSLKFVVPVQARLVYDPRVVEFGKIIESLKLRGCTISVERVRYGIPLRPLFLPEVWKTRVQRLGKELQGVVFASIDFVRSVIAVDYVPALVRPDEILDMLISKGSRHLERRKPATTGSESTHLRSDDQDPEMIRSGDGGSSSSIGTVFYRNNLESVSAQYERGI